MLDRLGPDLCVPGVDLDAVTDRLALLDPDTELAVALLDQRVAAGIGNVFKSEVCWAERVSPFTPIAALDDADPAAHLRDRARSAHEQPHHRAAHDVSQRPRRVPAGPPPLPALRHDDQDPPRRDQPLDVLVPHLPAGGRRRRLNAGPASANRLPTDGHVRVAVDQVRVHAGERRRRARRPRDRRSA